MSTSTAETTSNTETTSSYLQTTTGNVTKELKECRPTWYKYLATAINQQQLHLHQDFLEHKDLLVYSECLQYCSINATCRKVVVFDQTSCYFLSDGSLQNLEDSLTGTLGAVYTKY
ncbi:hypothetical protein EB796_021391 [Bugula neritina]|uniref:Uncharacterized protein n=1 Tax=Bugula neritina TaxID=10212 RepID=A0A7J7J3P8_BUGNE|nr:hypothetical protein EB796_021391 [Bugula neritina]